MVWIGFGHRCNVCWCAFVRISFCPTEMISQWVPAGCYSFGYDYKQGGRIKKEKGRVKKKRMEQTKKKRRKERSCIYIAHSAEFLVLSRVHQYDEIYIKLFFFSLIALLLLIVYWF